MPTLFEYHNWETVSNKGDLEAGLREMWSQRFFVDPEADLPEEASDRRFQPFLRFDGNRIRANNFVGFIQHGNDVIEIYPKVFKQLPDARLQKELMLRHIFYWFRYCRRWRFPFNPTSLDVFETDEFPELIINLIAHQFLETISEQPLTMYQQIEESLVTPRGTVNFGRYAAKSISYGKFHILECDHEPFLFDNRVNRIIKYCSRLLLGQTKFHESQRLLQEIIFILDDVEDTACSVTDIDKVALNSFFEDYTGLMNICRLIISQNLYSNTAYDLTQWCLLFPMEYIFEDFVAGFLEKHFQDYWKVEYQKSDEYLSNDPVAFRLQHDILLTSKSDSRKQIIVDTKYKLRDLNFKSDPKKGIAQGDLYQMVSYAVKRGCTDVALIYPNTSEEINEPDRFEIISGFEGRNKIRVTAFEIPFWSAEAFGELGPHLSQVLFRNLTGIIDADI